MKPKWCLVIIDDREEFALYTWRYLTQIIGLSRPGPTTLKEESLSPDGALALVFIQLAGGPDQQQRITDRIANIRKDHAERISVLIDVFARDHNPKSLAEELEKKDFNLKPAPPLDTREESENFNSYYQLVSAYPFNPGDFGNRTIEPKSLEFLEKLRRFFFKRRLTPMRAPVEGAVRHVLITGAGFEMRDPGIVEPGIDKTRKIISGMDYPFNNRAPEGHQGNIAFEDEEDDANYIFPVPQGQPEGALREAARTGNLDDYWDALIHDRIEGILAGLRSGKIEGKAKEAIKRKALEHEIELRDAFRRAFLRRDWGFLGQALYAARLGWQAWLTTNYTRFSDRAVDAIHLRYGLDWQVLSSVSEARALSGRSFTKDQGDKRYLFKLHGDLAHLQTMAIAGEDKDPYSQLPFPVDKLHWIYDAAKRFLLDTLAESDEVKGVVWHVVGHSLGDYPLLSLLDAVVGQVRKREKVLQWFVIADPYPSKPKEALTAAGIAQEDECRVYKVHARDYLARLWRSDFSYFETTGWIEDKFPDGFEAQLSMCELIADQ
jgi:hypothetical protein